jgi:poly-gamma-glutamate synthesis protein (capsule biosynthesis protein)
MNISIFRFSLSFYLLLAIFACSEISFRNSASFVQKNELKFDTVSLAIVGDLMCHSQQFQQAKKDSGYDFRPTFSAVKKYLEKADFTFGNLETVTAGSAVKFTGYPMFNSPVEYLDALKDAGFDVLTNANNHSLDRGISGVEKTIDELDKRNILHTGTARNLAERNTPLILYKNNTKLGILAYTYGTNGIIIPEGKEFCVNLIDSLQIKNDIEKSKAAGADAVVVFLHWGIEYERFGNEFQKILENYIHKNGALLVLGSHPHVLQPISVPSDNLKSGFTIFSLGNFISAQRKQYTDCGIILQLKLIKNLTTGEVSIINAAYIPTYVSKQNGFRILPVFDAIKSIKNGDLLSASYTSNIMEQQRIIEVLEETTKHMNNIAAGFLAKED